MHMCSTMGLGGFSSHDASFGYWNSPLIDYTAVFFMMLAGFNFSMHFLAWRRRSLLGVSARSARARRSFSLRLAASLVIAAFLLARNVYPDWPSCAALRAVQHGFDRNDDRLRQHRLQSVADLRAGTDALPVGVHDLRWFDRRRHQDDSCADPVEAGAARDDTHPASARNQSRVHRPPGHRKQCDFRGARVHAGLRRGR